MQISTASQSSALALMSFVSATTQNRSGQTTTGQPGEGAAAADGSGRGRVHHQGPQEGSWRNVWRGRDWSAGRTGEEEGRLRARVERLSVALARMTAENPAAQGARFTAIVVTRGANGISIAIAGDRVSGVSTEAPAALPVAVAPPPAAPTAAHPAPPPAAPTAAHPAAPTAAPPPAASPAVHPAATAPAPAAPTPILVVSPAPAEGSDDALAIVAGEIDGVWTGGGNDAVALAGGLVTNINTGAGDDALAIAAQVVSGIHLDGPMLVAAVDTEAGTVVATLGGPGGNDALSVAAVLINDVMAGGGDDRLALAGKLVSNIDGGDGADQIAIAARVVTGVTGGAGDDVITVSAQAGIGGLAQAASWLNLPPLSDQALLVRARAGYADVDGGAGNDVIAVSIGSVLSVSGGEGDDLITATGGTLSLLYGAGDGNDTVALGEGSQVMLQLSEDAGPYALEFGEDSMTVVMADGSITFTGVTSAGMIGIKQGEGEIVLIAQSSGQVLDRAV